MAGAALTRDRGGGLLRSEGALTLDGLDAGDVELERPQLLEALGVAEALLEADAEELLAGLAPPDLELFITEIADLFEFHCLFLDY